MKFAALGLALLIPIGCGARESTPDAARYFQHAQTLDVSATEYRVNPPDELTISAPAIKELDQRKTVIRPDGRIALNLLGELYVAGKTPAELGRMLSDLAVKYFNNPEIRVEVTGYNSKFYYLFGEVQVSGKKPFTGRDTIVSAMAEAGFTPDSWPQQVYLNRQVGPKPSDCATMVVNMKHMYTTGDVTQNFLIKENDIISVAICPTGKWRRILGDVTGTVTAPTNATLGIQTVIAKKPGT